MSVQAPTGTNLRLMVEDSAAAETAEQMTDGGDQKKFSSTGARFSLLEKDETGIDRRPVVRPDGLQNGCMVSPAVSGADDGLDVYGGTVFIANSAVTVSPQTDIAVTRPAASMKNCSSVMINASGIASVVGGTDGSAFSDTRGAAGGPPYVPAGQVELATVRLDSDTAAPLTTDEIFFAPEFTHAPAYRLLPYSASLEFASPLPLIHTGGLAKAVWITRYEPSLTQLDVVTVRPPAASFEIDRATGTIDRAKLNSGSIVISLSGIQTDLARRIDGGVRLFEFMPDSTQTRKEFFYAAVEIVADYSPQGLMTGAATLLPVEEPSIETE